MFSADVVTGLDLSGVKVSLPPYTYLNMWLNIWLNNMAKYVTKYVTKYATYLATYSQ